MGLRLVGILVCVAGALFIVVGMIDLSASPGSPRLVFLLTGIGLACLGVVALLIAWRRSK